MSVSMNRRELAGYLAPVTMLMVFALAVPLALTVYRSVGGTNLSGDAYVNLFQSRLFIRSTWTTLEISLLSTVVSMTLGYPIALHLSRLSDRWRSIFMILVLLPFWTSILVKSYALIVVLGDSGLVNSTLVFLGLPKVAMMFNRIGVLVGMSSYQIPFVIFPLLANLLAQDANLRKSAAVMGASDLRIFWKITFPLSLPGLFAGGVMCFVLAMGSFITPALLGGRKDMMVSNLIDFYTREALDWATASAIAVILFIASAALLWVMGRVRRNSALI
ncbi:ABC transporter permease [Burkholderia contaminans]|uniref:ABC transporter permease n=1 Tax=Burkholderia contaminans TaxID=488447 RepID=A0A3N8PTM9_9BURK|nr:ABC transporter permease [Burkholderia contaminans]RQT14954.1 ABC transporter permease [Burkholderia contaminans]